MEILDYSLSSQKIFCIFPQNTFMLTFLFLPAGFLPADDQETMAEIRKVGGTVRVVENGWEVEFHLSGRSLTDDQLVHVANLQGVTSLNLKRTQITSAGLVHLKGMTSLQLLHLELTAVGDQGMEHLAGLKKLKYLNLYGTEVTDKTLAELAGLKNLQIQLDQGSLRASPRLQLCTLVLSASRAG